MTAIAAQANLLTNGGFENTAGSYVGNSDKYMTVVAPSIVIPGWTVVSNNLAWMSSANPFGNTPSEGSFSLDLTGVNDNGTFAGIQQTFTTVAGASYHLSLDLGVNNNNTVCGNLNCKGPVGVSFQIDQTSVQNLPLFNPSVADAPGQAWQTVGMDFVAPTASTTLLIRGTAAGQFYLGLDNVAVDAVTAVPEPESYALMLAGLGLIACVARTRRRI